MTFSIGDLTSKDSNQFMKDSLANLADSLISKKGDEYQNFTNMKKQFTESEMNLICQTWGYPYEWVDDNEKFKHEGLPSRNDFFFKIKNIRNI